MTDTNKLTDNNSSVEPQMKQFPAISIIMVLAVIICIYLIYTISNN